MSKMINADNVIAQINKQKTFAKQIGKNNAYCKGLRDAIKIILAESIIEDAIEETKEDVEI